MNMIFDVIWYSRFFLIYDILYLNTMSVILIKIFIV